MTGEREAGAVPAPELLEVATTWWDVERVPDVAWDAAATRFDLIDPGGAGRLRLLVLARPASDPEAVARTLAEAFAACDFPPTGDGVPSASAATVAARLGLETADS